MSVILGHPGEKRFLLGNEAIARGILEAGVGFVATYPGTPSSEIVDTLSEVAKDVGMHVEYSTNEIIAYEAAFAASLAGIRSFFAAKHVGLNVAADAIATSAYIGTNAGFVFVSADDPHAHSSQNEQDNRNFARTYGLVMLEPGNIKEAKEMTVRAYEISEQLKHPVMIRTTTRVSHLRGIVELGHVREIIIKGKFDKNPARYVVVPVNARRNHAEMLKRLEQAKEFSERSELNFIMETSGNDPPVGRFGIISSGVSFYYAYEETLKMNISAKLLKLGFSYPLPEKKIIDFLESLDTVLIIEEIDPILEKEIKAIAKDHEIPVKIHGKDIFPSLYELRPEIVEEGIRIAMGFSTGKVSPLPFDTHKEVLGIKLPNRPPVLCPGCPHRASYYAVKAALLELKKNPREVIYPTDIGCMTLGIMPPYNMGDLLLCMGSSTGTSCGLSKVTSQEVIAFIGDSTFFHAGIPGLINAIYNRHPYILVILDNQITAMTGFQPDPSTGFTAVREKTKIIRIADVARALGADYVVEVDPVLEWKKAKEEFKKAWEAYKEGKITVVVFRHWCALTERHLRGYVGLGGEYEVTDKCIDCGLCYKIFNCPAILYSKERKKPFIRKDICLGCGVCMQICPVGAIIRLETNR